MDLVVLDPKTYLPETLFPRFDSLIWTEKYFGDGTFEIVTYNVLEGRRKLYPGVLVSLLDSDTVMIIKSNLVEEDENGNQKFKAVGRSFDHFLEHRAMYAPVYNEEWLTEKSYTSAEIAGMLAWTYLVQSGTEDPTKPTGTIFEKTQIQNLVVTDSTTHNLNPGQWWLKQGPVNEQFYDLLMYDKLGIRTVRPRNSSGTVLTYSTESGTRGSVQRTSKTDISELRLDIYNGKNRSHTQETLPQLIFLTEVGGLDKFSFLLSIEDYKDLALVVCSADVFEVFPPDVDQYSPIFTGLDRRILFYDGGSISETFRTKYRNTWFTSLVQKAQIELTKHNIKSLFDAQISLNSPYLYNKDYFLGDLVTLRSLDGYQETMMVTENIRTEDIEGERNYPGLSTIEPNSMFRKIHAPYSET